MTENKDIVKFAAQFVPAQVEPEAYVKYVKNHIMGGKGTDADLYYFIQVANRSKLDPMLRQIYAVFRNTKINGQYVDKMTIQAGIDGLRSVAEGTGNYAGSSEPVFTDEIKIEFLDYDKKKVEVIAPKTAHIVVRKIVNGQVFDVGASADFVEFYPGAKLGAQWHKMPKVMIAKCAEAQALRKAFPIISGIYLKEEMVDITPIEEVETKNQDIVDQINDAESINELLPIGKLIDSVDSKEKVTLLKMFNAKKKSFNDNT